MNITSLRIIEEVKKIGLDKPNFTYAPTENMTGGHIAFCSYNGPPRIRGEVVAGYEDRCGCIFGIAFENLGMSLPANFTGDIQAALDYLGIPYTDKNLEKMRECQKMQDKGAPWGESIKTLS